MNPDGFLHAVGVGELSKVGQIQPDSDYVQVSVSFMGLEWNMSVMKTSLVQTNGVPFLRVGDVVYIDCRLALDTAVKTFGDGQNQKEYVKSSLVVRRVMEFRKYVPEKK